MLNNNWLRALWLRPLVPPQLEFLRCDLRFCMFLHWAWNWTSKPYFPTTSEQKSTDFFMCLRFPSPGFFPGPFRTVSVCQSPSSTITHQQWPAHGLHDRTETHTMFDFQIPAEKRCVTQTFNHFNTFIIAAGAGLLHTSGCSLKAFIRHQMCAVDVRERVRSLITV